MVSDNDRRLLFTALEAQLGFGAATKLMELLPPVGWADVARQADLVAMRGEMAELRGELKGEMAELRGEMAQLRAELKGELTELRARIDGVTARLLVRQIPVMFATAGLVLAAAKLA